MKIVVLDAYTLNPGERRWEELEELGEVVVHDRTAQLDVVRRAKDAEVVLTNKTILDGFILNLLPKLKYIGVLATGYNVVDLDVARQRGIVVTNIPAYSTQSVAQMAIAHLLNITQRVAHYAHEVHNGVWSAQPDFCYWNTPLIELAGKKIGIVGFAQCANLTSIVIGNGLKIIPECLCYKCGNLVDVTIGSNVKYFGTGAFKTTPISNTIKKLHTLIKTPEKISCPPLNREEVFGYTIQNICTLYVPKGYKSTYEKCLFWKDFKNIIEE